MNTGKIGDCHLLIDYTTTKVVVFFIFNSGIEGETA